MTSNPRLLIALATLGSVGLLGGALLFQYAGGLAPCPLCIWQRWPHGIAIALGAGAYLGAAFLAPLAALAVTVGAGIGVYHTGIERRWWEGPSTCTTDQAAELTTDELLNQIMAAPLIRCDEVPWEFLTLSMASWNAIFSIGIAMLWVTAYRASR